MPPFSLSIGVASLYYNQNHHISQMGRMSVVMALTESGRTFQVTTTDTSVQGGLRMGVQ